MMSNIQELRGVSRTQLNIYDGAFFAKIINGFQSLMIFSKNSIVDVRPGSKTPLKLLNTVDAVSDQITTFKINSRETRVKLI